MSPSSSSSALAPSGPDLNADSRRNARAQLVPEWHGRYQARRGRRRSDPRLLRALTAMAVVSIVGAAILLAFLLLQDLRQTDRLHAESATLEATVAIEDLLGEVAETLEDIAPNLSAYSANPDDMTAASRRQSRRDVFAALDDSPITGLALVNSLGAVLLETGDAQRGNMTTWTKLPLEPSAKLLNQQMAFLAPETGQGVQALFGLPGQDRAVVALIEEKLLADALTPRSDAIRSVYLSDGAGRVLAASRGSDAIVSIGSAPRSARPRMATEHSAVSVKAGSEIRNHGQAATRPTGEPGLYVTAIPKTITVARFFASVGHLLLAGIAFALMTISLLLYVIQTEWKKHDRRANLDEDVVARSEIAADIMGAGIIDWRVTDAVVSYSEGWQRLFSDGAPTEDEEIFDWIDKLHPDCRSLARENYEALIAGRIFEVEHELKVRRRDGDYITVRERGRARMNAQGSATRVVLVQRLARG
ncbi:MAG: PAS domain-containing protein [Hyphomonas sp.]|nr:PAS domain-containing protein [Hyphomonas sp.]